MKARTIEALRALAERPGTEAEGIVAREILARYGELGISESSEPWDWEAEFVKQKAYWATLTGDALIEAIRRSVMDNRLRPMPTVWRCACGAVVKVREKCYNYQEHSRIQEEIRRRFKKGDRVLYKHFEWEDAGPGVVTGYVREKPANGDHPWAWLRVKFDRCKNPNQIPVKGAKGWLLTHEPKPLEVEP